MSIALVVTRGYSNGTLVGTIPDVVTRGYTIGSAVPDIWTLQPDETTLWAEQTDDSSTWTEQ